jgi:predicted secreted protein
MAPASKTAPFAFEFIANSESGKFDEVDSHSEVNVSFYDQSSTDWISVAGNAHASSDKARIKGEFRAFLIVDLCMRSILVSFDRNLQPYGLRLVR